MSTFLLGLRNLEFDFLFAFYKDFISLDAYSLFPILFNIVLEVLARVIRKERKQKASKLERKKQNDLYSPMT